MSIYNIDGTLLSDAYDKDSTLLQSAYDINGNNVLGGRQIVFEDDFNFFDSSKWVKEIGLVRNQNAELQCYREENVTIENSCLVLTAKRESYGNREWTSGSISGQTIQSFQYGRFEAKIKFPNITGAFGAFWCLGSNFWKTYVDGGTPINHGVIWSQCGEIDITEIFGARNQSASTIWNYTGGRLDGATYYSDAMATDTWHIYAMEWTSEYIAVYLDGVEYHRWIFSDYDASAIQAYFLPFYMILNLAVGASGGTPSESTNQIKMYVDWVRVYAPLA